MNYTKISSLVKSLIHNSLYLLVEINFFFESLKKNQFFLYED